MIRIKQGSITSSHQRRPVSVSSISRRGAVVLSLVAPITLLQAKDAIANELIPEGEVKMSDEVRKRKERLAAKAAAKEKVVESKSSSSGPARVVKEEAKGSSLLVNPNKTAELAAGKNARLAAFREKAAKMRAGGEPTF